MIAFDQKLDRVAQGGHSFHQNRLTPDESHFHKTPPGAATPSNSEDRGPLTWHQIAQPRPDSLVSVVATPVMPMSSVTFGMH